MGSQYGPLKDPPPINLHDRKWRIHAVMWADQAIVGEKAKISNSLVAEGSDVNVCRKLRVVRR